MLFIAVGIVMVVGLGFGTVALRSSPEVIEPTGAEDPSPTSEAAPASTLTTVPQTTTAGFDDVSTTEGPPDDDVSTTVGTPEPGPDDDCIIGALDSSGLTITTVVKCSEVPTTGPPEPPPVGTTPDCQYATTVPGGTIPPSLCDDAGWPPD